MRAKKASAKHRASEDRWREAWRWDDVRWGCHAVDCYPGGCPFRVYTRNGRVVREEQAGTFRTIQPGVPDMNPMGCQKGVSWSQQHYNEERVLHPLKRVGRRGEGKFQPVSWEQALTEIADAILDAVEEQGPDSCLHIGTPGEGGTQHLMFSNFTTALGFCNTDLQAEINDFSPGIHTTFGKFDPAPTMDDYFHTELCLVWHSNPVYTSINSYHFIQEARYNGGEVVTIAPDFNPSAIHADVHIPIEIGTDAAFALAMCQTIVAEGLVDLGFVKEQTDLPLLVRTDTRRFLRAADVEDGGHEEQFYWIDARAGAVVPAPRHTLASGEVDPALVGSASVTLRDGTAVVVEPAFVRLRELLHGRYTPELASAVCKVHPDTIRNLGRKVARRRTRIMMGWNSGKYYHGDLMERAMMLLLALTGNWGKPGTGARSWAVGLNDGIFIQLMKQGTGPAEAEERRATVQGSIEAIRAEDPTMTDEMAQYRFMEMAAQLTARMTPPALLWYYHCGYREIWNKAGWGDAGMRRSFDAYVDEAVARGWWPDAAVVRDTQPRFLIEVGGNLLRRMRGGADMLLEHLWPKLKMIVSVDWRLNTTALYADYVLPAAQHYEKLNNPYAAIEHLNVMLIEKAAEPAGEARSEWQICIGLARALEERARARGIGDYTDRRGTTRTFAGLYDRVTRHGAVATDEALIADIIQDSAVLGTIPRGTTLDSLRKTGFVRAIDWGSSPLAVAQQSDIKPNETHQPFRRHVEGRKPYPTLTRRAQFYIDHEWYLEGGEELPVHKGTPGQGGDYPLLLTSGHPRWSIHSMNHTNEVILGTHRGHPVMYMNPGDAARRGLANDDEARLFNDMSEIRIRVRVSPGTRPGQVVIYNGYEPFQFKGWLGAENVEPGMVKWLHFAGGYGHLHYRLLHWQPIPVDRGVHVEAARA